MQNVTTLMQILRDYKPEFDTGMTRWGINGLAL
jgi:hypothetical protein